MYWQAAIITCQSHGSMLQPPIPQKEKWIVKAKTNRSQVISKPASWRKTESRVISVAGAVTESWPLTLWEFSLSCILTFFRNNADPNKTSTHEFCPSVIWNKLSPSFNLQMECLFFSVPCFCNNWKYCSSLRIGFSLKYTVTASAVSR